MECGYLITLCLKNRALVPSRAKIWPQTHVAKRIKKMTMRNGKHPEKDCMAAHFVMVGALAASAVVLAMQKVNHESHESQIRTARRLVGGHYCP